MGDYIHKAPELTEEEERDLAWLIAESFRRKLTYEEDLRVGRYQGLDAASAEIRARWGGNDLGRARAVDSDEEE